jgi:hypothetical protein
MAYLHDTGKSLFAWDCVVADAVEPVSIPISVLTGKNTAKFSRICPLLLGALAKRADNSTTFDIDSLQN